MMSHDKAADLWIEQSKMLWGRLKTAWVIEGAALAGAYKLLEKANSNLAALALFFSAIFLFLLLCIMARDCQNMKSLRSFANGEQSKPFDNNQGGIFEEFAIKNEPLRGRHFGFFMLIIPIVANLIGAIILFK